MEKELKEYLASFEQRLNAMLFDKCISLNIINGERLPESEDIMQWWKENAPFYMSDAVREFNSYPIVVLAWASFLAMGITSLWDKDWDSHKKDEYHCFYGQEGYDDMDENIMQNYLNLTPESKQWNELSDTLRSLANETYSFIRHEAIDGGTEKAFHVLAKALKCMFRIGSAIQLNYLGYKWKKVSHPQMNSWS